MRRLSGCDLTSLDEINGYPRTDHGYVTRSVGRTRRVRPVMLLKDEGVYPGMVIRDMQSKGVYLSMLIS